MSAPKADLILVLMAALWGAGFPATKWALLTMQPCTFIAWRFLFASAVLLLLFRRKAIPRTRKEWSISLMMGLLLGSGYVFQTIGLQYTTSAKAGFITGLYIVFVPVIEALFERKRISWQTWLGILTSFSGLALLCITKQLTLENTDLWIVACALVFGFQIYGISHWGASLSPLGFTTGELFFAGLTSLIGALFLESPLVGFTLVSSLSLVYTVLFATCIAFVVQTKVQHFTSATHAALIYTLEAVFAALMGWWWLNDKLSLRDLCGCALIGLGIVIVEIRFTGKQTSKSAIA